MVATSLHCNGSKIIHTEALNEWIKNLKSKRQFKRKISRGQDLFAIAILQNSLIKNQKMLQQRQRERSQKWLKMKKMLEESSRKCDNSENESSSDEDKSYNLDSLEREERQMQIKKIWNEDLSDIETFMNSLDSVKTTLVR